MAITYEACTQGIQKCNKAVTENTDDAFFSSLQVGLECRRKRIRFPIGLAIQRTLSPNDSTFAKLKTTVPPTSPRQHLSCAMERV